jgi:DNA-binding GntR family transcriptional regulator
VHQSELAERLNVSRIPLREALSTLNAEGVLTHKANTGYRVARFSSEDLSEIYLMRRLLETALLQSIVLTADAADELQEANDRLRQVNPAIDPDLYQRLNHEFHFRLFDRSPFRLVREEVERLWYRSGFYRSLYLHEAGTQLQVDDDHEQIIRAVRENNVKALIAAMDAHRSGTENLVIERLGRSRMR